MGPDQVPECGGCGSEERWLLHNVRHRGIYHRLCTSCVLKFHPGMFCPICFEVYEGPQTANGRVTCLKCTSLTHLGCVGLDVASRYVCPPCLNPSFSFFDFRASNKKNKGSDGEPVLAEGHRAIDQKSAKILVTATRLASISMNKAANIARIEAERRAKEAALSKKRAREALERVFSIEVKEKEKVKERVKESMGLPGSAPVAEQKKKSKANNAVSASLPVQKRNQNHVKMEGGNKPGGFPRKLDNAGSIEKGRWAGFQAPNVVQGSAKNGTFTEGRDKLKAPIASAMERQKVQNHVPVNETENSANLPHLQNHVGQGEKEKNGSFSVPSGAGKLHNAQNNHRMEEDRVCSGGFAVSEMGPLPLQSKQDVVVSKNDSGVLITGSSNAKS